jgi:hypothetical protein
MASEAHFRIPQSMKGFFPELLMLLDIPTLFPNVAASSKPRLDFLKERSALLVDPKTGDSRPVTDAVIFTGTPTHADQLRSVFDKRTLFIANGAGHNPVVISRDANLSQAVEAVLSLQFYNQGQDCAAPNAILVHAELLPAFLSMLRNGIRATSIGQYRDISCRIGPISDPEDLVRIQNVLIQHREWLDPTTPGIIRAADAVVEPTIICKPLARGGNFSEVFAPIIFVQEFDDDARLASYFEDPRYANNAMYVTVYGTSAYVTGLIDRPIGGTVLHRQPTLLRNTHLHAPGIERGTQPYGGYGRSASSISINGRTVALPTLPQRDIFERVARPLLRKRARARGSPLARFTTTQYRPVEKLLRLRTSGDASGQQAAVLSPHAHIDSQALEANGARFVRVPECGLYRLLGKPNKEYGATLEAGNRASVRSLQSLLRKKSSLRFDAFRAELYAIPTRKGTSAVYARASQRRFFQDVYQLLFGKASGPQLASFLWETECDEITRLLQAW